MTIQLEEVIIGIPEGIKVRESEADNLLEKFNNVFLIKFM